MHVIHYLLANCFFIIGGTNYRKLIIIKMSLAYYAIYKTYLVRLKVLCQKVAIFLKINIALSCKHGFICSPYTNELRFVDVYVSKLYVKITNYWFAG